MSAAITLEKPENICGQWSSYGDLIHSNSGFLFLNESNGTKKRTLELFLAQTEFDEDDIPSFARDFMLIPMGIRESVENANDDGSFSTKGSEDIYYFFADRYLFTHGHRNFSLSPSNKEREYHNKRFKFDYSMEKLHTHGGPISQMLFNINYVGHDPVTRGLVNNDLYKPKPQTPEFESLVIPMCHDSCLKHDFFKAQKSIIFPEHGDDSKLRKITIILSNSYISNEDDRPLDILYRLVTPLTFAMIEEFNSRNPEYEIEGHEDMYLYTQDGEAQVHAYRSYFKEKANNKKIFINPHFKTDYNFGKPNLYSQYIKDTLNLSHIPHIFLELPAVSALKNGKPWELSFPETSESLSDAA